jgi:4-methyl-5(b-hydroxyethyl)-thiazole monophosphate biosynthesis
MPTVLIPLAEGCEELEAVTLIDLLRRAGVTVVTASLAEQRQLIASRGTCIVADTTLSAVIDDSFDMIILPGGQPGTNHLNADVRLHDKLKSQVNDNKYVAAICAAPLVLATAGLLYGCHATAFPNVLKQEEWPDITLLNDSVVIDNKVVTSKGPGTAMDFALTLIELLTDTATRHQVESGLVRV